MELERCFTLLITTLTVTLLLAKNSFKGNNNILKQLVISGRIVLPGLMMWLNCGFGTIFSS